MKPTLLALSLAIALPWTGGPARAADLPTGSFPAETARDTVSAYGGIVLAGEQIGNRVYVAGTFTSVGRGSGTTPRSYLIAVDATTGDLDPTFNPQPTGRVDSLVSSPDGSVLYAGGIFSAIGGCSRCRGLAKLDPVTGAADPGFTPQPNSAASRLIVSGSRLFLGGWFTTVAGQPRAHLAAVDATTGVLDPALTVSVDNKIKGMSMSPDGRRLYIAGDFGTVGGLPRTRFASVDVTANAVTSWDPGARVQADGWDVTLSPDGQHAYLATANGAAWWGGGLHESVIKMPAVFDGPPTPDWVQAWAPNGMWNTGDVNTLVATGDTVFAGGHLDSIEDGSAKRKHLMAIDDATGSVLPWNPFATGARGVLFAKMLPSGLFIGGDFPAVHKAPRSLFALLPVMADTSTPSRPNLSARSDAPGSVTLRWPASIDKETALLTYTVYRDGAPVQTLNARSTPFRDPTLSWTDTGLPAGSDPTYKVVVSDGVNRSTSVAASVSVAAQAPARSYLQTVLADDPTLYWRLGDTGAVAQDETSAGRAGQYSASGIGRSAGSSLVGDTNSGVTLDGVTGAIGAAPMSSDPTTFSLEVRFKASGTGGGKLLGFGNSRSGTSGSYDRHVYLDNAGRLVFGAYPGHVVTVTSPTSYTDGQWHAAVATLGADGMRLYVDGTLVGSDPNTGAQSFIGFWKVGYDNLAGWPNRPASDHFAGSLDEVAVYPVALSATQVAAHWAAGR